MGIQYRDYMRDDASPGGFGSTGWQGRDMVKTLIIVNVVVFILQSLFTHGLPEDFIQQDLDQVREGFSQQRHIGIDLEEVVADREADLRSVRFSYVEEWFKLDPQKVLHGQIWRLTTYDFLHDTSNIWHILFNMWVLWLAGRNVESFYGPREFLVFYLLAGVLSGVCFMLWGLYFHDLTPAIGASGAVVAVMIAYAVRWPHEIWLIFGIIRCPVIIIAIITAAMDLHPLLRQLGGLSNFGDGVAHSAHVGGMLFGFLYSKRNWRLLPWVSFVRGFPGLKSFARGLRRPQVRLHRPDPVAEAPVREPLVRRTPKQEVEQRVDELLAKIQAQGEASLTDEERNFLAEASRHYRS